MRREAVILVALGLALCVASCSRSECPECPECPERSTGCVVDPDLSGDVVSGCDTEGSPFVKALVHLEEGDDKRCRVRVVEPQEGLCVVQGGVIRWKVDNGCGPLEGDEKTPAIMITRLVNTETDRDATWLSDVCEARIQSLKAGAPRKTNLLFCDVPADAPVGDYKYSLGGRIEPLDPPIGVRPPRGS